MKKVLSGLPVVILALMVFVGSAFAAVTFDTATGQGFVGKGDVQLALSYNNSEMQKNAGNLLFTYETTEAYEITVTWVTGEGTRGEKTHLVSHKRTKSVDSNIAYEARKANQINGFFLKGFTKETVEGTIPAIGDQFPGNSGHIVTAVTLVPGSSTGGLFVNGVQIQ